MELNEALDLVKGKLPEKRFKHVVGVVDTARRLAEKFQVDVKKAELAAAFHDISKYDKPESMQKLITDHPETFPQDLLQFHHELWHAHVGAWQVEHQYGITDQDILNAIRYHTTGRVEMTALEKIIFLADFIEPGRTIPQAEECRKLVDTGLDVAVLHAYQSVITYLVQGKALIYPTTFYGYNDLVSKTKN